MKRIYDKQPREHHRKRSHYNSRGVAKLSFDNEKAAARYINARLLRIPLQRVQSLAHWKIAEIGVFLLFTQGFFFMPI